MLSTEERKELDNEILHYELRESACIDALRIVQRHRRWISDESVKDVAEYLGMSADEVDGVATFYNLIFRRPVGEHIILFCDSVSCWICGCDAVRTALQQRLNIRPGETTADGRFTLLTVQCLGACDRAPTMMIDDELYTGVTPESAGEILSRHEQQRKENGAPAYSDHTT